MRLKEQSLKDGHIYLVPRLFPGHKEELHQKYGVVYDLCLYSKKQQYNTTGKMVNFYVIDSDNRDKYYPYVIWQTSSQKIVYGERRLVESIDVTNVYANKIQRWFTTLRKDRAAQFISDALFTAMLEPTTGWLYKRTKRNWEAMFASM